LSDNKNTLLDDPDYDLEQYSGRMVENASGFKTYIPPRDLEEVPELKRTKIQELLNAQPGDNKPKEEVKLKNDTSDLYTVKARVAAKDISSVEGLYFMYKFKRNSWR
jgi:hypothetical protein